MTTPADVTAMQQGYTSPHAPAPAHQVVKVHVGAAVEERPGVPGARVQLDKGAMGDAERAQVARPRPRLHAAARRRHR